jgi:diguanylate cyclase (GGDEF)-like protein
MGLSPVAGRSKVPIRAAPRCGTCRRLVYDRRDIDNNTVGTGPMNDWSANDSALVVSAPQPVWETDLAIAVRELARARQELQTLKLRHRAVMEGVEEGVVLLDDKGRITTINTAALRLFSTEAAIREWIWGGSDLAVLDTPRAVPAPGPLAATPAGTERPHPVIETLLDLRSRRGIEMRAVTAEGIERWLSVSVRALADGETLQLVGAVCSFSDITARRQQREDLERQATVDPLTGAFNRRYLERRVMAEASRARRSKLPLAVAVGDLDHFKDVNDRFGHAAGDAALQAFVAVLMQTLRTEDVVARVGGDEFCILFPGTGAQAAATGLERCLRSLRTTEIDTAGSRFRVSGTFGIAELGPGQGAEAVLARADEALYRAKAAGRGRVLVHPDSLAKA